MTRFTVEKAIILGAGFSSEAKLPLTSKLSKGLLNPVSVIEDHEFEKSLTQILQKFFQEIFRPDDCKTLPSMEDLFTLIDLSANSGHNLGRLYSPNLLRIIRRALIYRVLSNLNAKFEQSEAITAFLKEIIPDSNNPLSHFIVLNWDIVLEKHLSRHLKLAERVDYGIHHDWADAETFENDNRNLSIAKVHGSSNWQYCDNCRRVQVDWNSKSALPSLKSRLALELHSFNNVGGLAVPKQFQRQGNPEKCPNCNCEFSAIVATFSFKKSFRTHALASAWLTAEQLLTMASEWMFVGYSLPDADYEFKHLLKTCQSKTSHMPGGPKKITVITADKSTLKRYQLFFGRDVVESCVDKLAGYVQRER